MKRWLPCLHARRKGVLLRAPLPGGLLILLTLLLSTSARMPLIVTLIPRSQVESGTYQFIAVSGKADPGRQQIALRTVISSSPPQVAMLAQSGSLPAHHATGELVFLNNTAQPITIFPTILTGKSHIPVTFSGPLTIPANDPPEVMTTGVATLPGSQGEIPAFDLDHACCHAGIVVKNTTAFSLTPETLQSQVKTLVEYMKLTLQENVQTSLAYQVRRNERVVPGSTTCRAIQTITQRGTTTRVLVAVTCAEHVYDDQAARAMATRLLVAQHMHDSQRRIAYAFVRATQFREVMAAISGQNSLTIQVWGLWVAHFAPEHVRQLAQMIAGQQEKNARALLLGQAGIANVLFSCKQCAIPGVDDMVIIVSSPAVSLFLSEGDTSWHPKIERVKSVPQHNKRRSMQPKQNVPARKWAGVTASLNTFSNSSNRPRPLMWHFST